MAVRQVGKTSVKLSGKVHVHCWTPVAWALSFGHCPLSTVIQSLSRALSLEHCCSCVQRSCGKPQQQWRHDTCGMAPVSVLAISSIFCIVGSKERTCSLNCYWRDSCSIVLDQVLQKQNFVLAIWPHRERWKHFRQCWSCEGCLPWLSFQSSDV